MKALHGWQLVACIVAGLLSGCANLAPSGEPAWGAHNPVLSRDGRFVAFEAWGKVPFTTPAAVPQIFRMDVRTGEVVRVSEAPDGAPGDQASAHPSISDDGSLVAFASRASNLVPADSNNASDVLVWNATMKSIRRVSVPSNGSQASGAPRELGRSSVDGVETIAMGVSGAENPSLSGNGRAVAFEADFNNLVPHDDNSVVDIFVHRLLTGETIRASVAHDGTDANGSSSAPSLDQGGGRVAFESVATNLVAAAYQDDMPDIFVRDLIAGTTLGVTSATIDPIENTYDRLVYFSTHPTLAGNGQALLLQSRPLDARLCGDENPRREDFLLLFDVATERLRCAVGPGQLPADAFRPTGGVLDTAGTKVAFQATEDLNRPNAGSRIYLLDLNTQALKQATVPGWKGMAVRAANPALDGPGIFVAFEAQATKETLRGTTATESHVFLFDARSNATRDLTPGP